MSEAHVNTDGSPAARLQTFANQRSEGGLVHAEAVVLVDVVGEPIQPATSAGQAEIVSGIGSDGDGAPAVSGTGVRGWLRACFERLSAGLPLFKPAAADIVSSSRAGSTGTLITVPSGRTWKGRICASAQITTNAGGGAVAANLTVSWSPGTGGTAAYSPLDLRLGTPAIGALTALGANSAVAANTGEIYLYAGTANATLMLAQANCTAYSASASGVLL